jgi:hypothetical protein
LVLANRPTEDVETLALLTDSLRIAYHKTINEEFVRIDCISTHLLDLAKNSRRKIAFTPAPVGNTSPNLTRNVGL